MVDIRGHAEDGFGAVADAFRANFDGVELGAGFCLYVDGKNVVDLTGGYADVERTRPTTMTAFSLSSRLPKA